MRKKQKRDWKSYNDQLVKRGELLIDLDFVENWEKELEEMNLGKRGKPFDYPESLIEFLAFPRFFFKLPFRQEEGFVEALAKLLPELGVPDYTTIHRRINRLKPKFERSLRGLGDDVVIAVDASGIKVTNRGEWRRELWGGKSKRGYLKIHVAVDVKTGQILAMEVTDDRTGDSRKFKSLVERASERANVKLALADSAYDSRENFNLLETKGIEPGIRIKHGASGKARGSWARRHAALEFLKNEKKWKQKVGYGRRWTAEGTFSNVKRTFGEFVVAKKFKNMVQEMMLKAFTYNVLMNLSASR
ncbi:MAG: IS5 family transposase [Hadesarchaea archaeon]|nr:MAG: IS5 family transposase [Hadesarchaea archaeon]